MENYKTNNTKNLDLLELNSNAIKLLERTVRENPSRKGLIDSCNRTIDTVLSDMDVDFNIYK